MLDTSLPPVPEHIPKIISEHLRLMEQIQMAANDTTITPSQAIMIMMLGKDKVKACDIRRLGYYPGTNASYNLRILKRAGYIKRSDVNGDRRQKLVSLTPRGLELCVWLRKRLAGVSATV